MSAIITAHSLYLSGTFAFNQIPIQILHEVKSVAFTARHRRTHTRIHSIRRACNRQSQWKQHTTEFSQLFLVFGVDMMCCILHHNLCILHKSPSISPSRFFPAILFTLRSFPFYLYFLCAPYLFDCISEQTSNYIVHDSQMFDFFFVKQQNNRITLINCIEL